MGTISAERRALFEAHFLAAYQPLMAHAISKLRHKQDAEDLVSRTALKAWRAWPTYKDDNFGGWIHCILANEIKDFHRSNVRRSFIVDPNSFGLYSADIQQMAIDGDQEGSHERRDAGRYIAALPTVEREALMLAAGGESYEDIATSMRMSVQNVKSNLHRARKKLRAAAV